ncbi:hypothetical protein hamaS1_27390 [Moorella sp. Hama-1]|nr:hypothetical protein hamaS1_27390 [Moorella sp. Hama-1]
MPFGPGVTAAGFSPGTLPFRKKPHGYWVFMKGSGIINHLALGIMLYLLMKKPVFRLENASIVLKGLNRSKPCVLSTNMKEKGHGPIWLPGM